MEYLTLNNGVRVPMVGFGTWKLNNETVIPALLDAFALGYRHIDTASYYGNEKGIGEAIVRSGLDRSELFITTKCWSDDKGYDQTLAAFDRSLELLGLEFIDLYLIHWPTDKDDETWRALETLYRSGKVRAIGVSNFEERHFERLSKYAKIPPMINQIERHPLQNRNALIAYCNAHNIAVSAWSPLARAAMLTEPQLVKIATKHGVSASQVILRWHLQAGVATFPKSSNTQRIQENISIFDFELSDEEVLLIDSLSIGKRVGNYPENYDSKNW